MIKMDKEMKKLIKAADKCVNGDMTFEEFEKIHKEVLG